MILHCDMDAALSSIEINPPQFQALRLVSQQGLGQTDLEITSTLRQALDWFSRCVEDLDLRARLPLPGFAILGQMHALRIPAVTQYRPDELEPPLETATDSRPRR